ncbi:hypothetical protein B0H16DRAFT_863069 [Mycena metata]|uniref:Uncharacterized protein n=1 Tax=Mycena metata TaxID=1033252 RepID=A0AAD7ISZ5_9AGAR|nr:hypothetical protein B0H16DRAFT_863069 [Mycena metata]
MSDVDMNNAPPLQLPPPPPAQNPPALLPPVGNQAAAPPPQAPAAAAPAPVVIPIHNVPAPAPFVLPDEATIAAHVPQAAARNPHLQALTPQGAPPVDAEGRAHFQQLDPRFRPLVRTNAQLEEHIAETHLAAWKATPYRHITITVANGGDQLFNKVDWDVPLEDKFHAALRTLAPDGVLTVEAPVPTTMEGAQITGSKYRGSSTLLVTVESNAGADAICAQHVLGLDPSAGGWAIDHAANVGKRIWVLAHHTISRGKGTKEEIEASGRAGIVRATYKCREAFLKVDQGTAYRGGPAEQRVFDALNTIHCEYIPDAKTPVLVTYMEPVGSEQDHENLAKVVRKLNFAAGRFGFTTRSAQGHAKECVLCKGADHPSFKCPYKEDNYRLVGPAGTAVGAAGQPPPPPSEAKRPERRRHLRRRRRA